MINFEAIGSGGERELDLCVQALISRGAKVLQKDSYSSSDTFKIKAQCLDQACAEFSVEALGFSLVSFD